MDITERRKAADALRAIKRGGEGWFSLSDAVLGRPAPRDEVVARLADLIDPGEDVSMSAYDLLPVEEREALRWMHRHGGLDEVRRDFQDAYNRHVELCAALGIDMNTGWSDAMAEMVKRLMPEAYEWTDAFAEAVDFMECVHDLLYTIDGGEHTSNEMFAKMMKRLMPEGYEWPRLENGEPLRVGGEWDAGERGRQRLEALTFDNDGYTLHSDYYDDFRHYGERVKRPAPKVLDAGGAEIRVGDHVWNEVGTAFTAIAVDGKNKSFKAMRHFDGQECEGLDPALFTHRAPVLAADGEPLREGEHVYHVETGAELVVKKLPKPGGYQAVVVFALPTSPASDLTSFDPDRLTHERPVLDADGRPLRVGETVWSVDSGTRYTVEKITDELIPVKCRSEMGTTVSLHPSQFTHERPENWERLEEDAGKNPFDYCKDVGHRLDTCENFEAYKARDLVRRCKALAGVSE